MIVTCLSLGIMLRRSTVAFHTRMGTATSLVREETAVSYLGG